jgi:hypothetical protein
VDRRAWLLSIVAALVVLAAVALAVIPAQSLPTRSIQPSTITPGTAPAPRSIAPADLYDAFGSPGKGMSFGQTVSTTVEEAGEVVLPSGRLVASDAFIIDALPFTTTFPPGHHRVSVLRADFANAAPRIAAAVVRVGAGEPVRWELALIAGQDPTTLGQDQFFGYGVDGGTGCFTSPEATARLRDPDTYERYSVALLEGLNPGGMAPPGTFAVEVDPGSGANVVAFESGFGDGAYASFIGLDGTGRPLVVMTDFAVLDAVGA